MNRGYVKLWRKTIDSGLLQNAAALQVFTYCLLKASHKHSKILVGTTPVDVEPGQVVTGRLAIAKECKLSEQNVRTALKLLENLEILTIKATNKFSIISFVNWNTYQQDQPADQPTSQPISNQQVTSAQPAPNHKQEFKNLRNINNNPPTPLSGGDGAPSPRLRFTKADSLAEIDGYTENQDLRVALSDFVDSRQAMKKPLTARALKLTFTELNKLATCDADKVAIVNQSVLNGWQGLFPLKEQPRSKDPYEGLMPLN